MSQQSFHQQTANGSNIAFTITTFSEDEIKVYVDGVESTNGGSSQNDYTIPNYTTTGGTVTWNTTGSLTAPASPSVVRVVRQTDVMNNGNTAVEGRATYTPGSSVKADDLNNNTKQALRAILEQQDQKIQRYDIEDGEVVRSKIAADAIDGTKIEDDSINSEHYADGSIDTAHIADSQVTTVKIANDAVNNDKLADNSVNTAQLIDSAVATAKIADTAVTTAKIADDAVTADKLANSINTAIAANTSKTSNVTHTGEVTGATALTITNGAVGTAKIADTAVTTAKIADANVTTAKIADGAITDAKIAGGSLDNRYYTETELDAGQLDNRYFTETELTNGALDGRYFTETEADARYFNITSAETIKDGDAFPDNDTTIATTAAINDRIVDIVDNVGGFVPLVDEGEIPQYHPEKDNAVTSDRVGTILSIGTLTTTYTPSGGTVTIQASDLTNHSVNATITDCGSTVLTSGLGVLIETKAQTDAQYAAGPSFKFHRLVPSSTDTSTVATNITNVNAVGNAITNVNSVASNATNINTVATAITNVDNVGGSIANVNTVASNLSSVNSFANTYRIGANNPTTSLDTGDLFFNTTSDSLKVYTGSAWVDGVTATGNFAVVTGNTFTGSNVHNDNVKSIYGTSSDGLEIFHNASNSIINDQGTGTLQLQTGGSTKLEIQSGGIGVTGNIVVSGTVDGVDIATLLADVVSDTSPQLGGDLDVQAQQITTSTTNGNIKLTPNGTGVIEVKGAGGADGTLQLNCSANSHGVKIKSPPHSAAASYTLTLPDTDGSANQVLKTDGSGNLDWVNQTTDTNTQLSTEEVQDIAGPLVATGGTKTGITVTYDDANGDMDFVVDDTTKLPLTGGTLTGNLIISSTHPKFKLVDTDHNSDFEIMNNHGNLLIYDSTNGTSPFNINSSGNIQISGTIDGRDLATDGSKLDGIEAGATADQTASEILTLIKTVDGAGSGLDADTVDGFAPTSFLRSDANDTASHHITFSDNAKVKIGTGEDLQIYHDGNNSYLDNVTGELRLQTDGTMRLMTTNFNVVDENNSDTIINAAADGAVELYYDNTKMFETTSSGIKLAKNCQAPLSTLTDGATITVDFSTATHFTVTLGGNRTFGDPSNVSNAVGSSGSIFIVQDGTGSRTAAFHADYKFAGGSDPTLTTTANAVDRIDYIVRANHDIHCVFTADVK